MDPVLLAIGFVLMLLSILFVMWMDKLWFRITLGILFVAAIVAIAYYGGTPDKPF